MFRRVALGMVIALSLWVTWSGSASAANGSAGSSQPQDIRASLDRGYTFLNTMMDAYQTGATTRLIQSYSDENGLGSTAFTYDNALAIIAYLQRRTDDDVARARILGDALLYAQNHDPNYQDGRLRQAYWVGPFTVPGLTANSDYFVKPNGQVNLVGWPWYFTGSAVGDMAWAGLALTHLYFQTHDQRYLDGAVRLGTWIVSTTYDTRGPGGYDFGVDGNNTLLTYKSTEHNIDVYGLFCILAGLTQDAAWTQRADHALRFIQAMWNPAGGFFWTGTTADGATINRYPVPEDVQTWSYLALHAPQYAASIDWATSHLTTTDIAGSPNASFGGDLSFTGLTFSNASLQANPNVQPNPWTPKPDPNAVWFEGTGHGAAALLERHAPGDRELAETYLNNIRAAQATLGGNQHVNGRLLPVGYGVVAASSPLDTGFGFDYFPYLHIGATSWYLIASQAGNPYDLDHGRGTVQ